MAPVSASTGAAYGLSTNKNGGQYKQGKGYSLEKKLEVAECYTTKFNEGEERPSLSAIARECHVGWAFVKKVEEVILEHGRIIPPEDNQQQRAIGPGSKTLDQTDEAFLLHLHSLEPSRSLSSYQEHLQSATGNVVSKTTISCFFNHGFPIKGSLRKANLIPVDKFLPINLDRATEYLNILQQIDPTRLKFGDDKLLKGDEVYNRKTRRNVLTGEVPPITTTSDFRNTYSITGICSIDASHQVALWHQVHDDKNDADSFSLCIETAIANGFLRRGDVLVLDNAALHVKGDNRGLEEWLWDDHGILASVVATN